MVRSLMLFLLSLVLFVFLEGTEETKLYAHWKCYQCGEEYDLVPRRCTNIVDFDAYKQCGSIIFFYFDSIYCHGTKADPFQEVDWNLPPLKTQ